MTLHNRPKFNNPRVREVILSQGLNPNTPSMGADLIRIGHAEAEKTARVEEMKACIGFLMDQINDGTK